MGNAISQYNPLSVYGAYNLKKSAYENKKTYISVLSFALLIVAAAIVMLYVTGDEPSTPKRAFSIPPPKYGLGPYGYGLYIPPVNMIR